MYQLNLQNISTYVTGWIFFDPRTCNPANALSLSLSLSLSELQMHIIVSRFKEGEYSYKPICKHFKSMLSVYEPKLTTKSV